MELRDWIAQITPPDEGAAAAARAHWDRVAKPLGSLGLLEEALVRVAALTGEEELQLSPRVLLVFCADNGVVARGVTQCGPEVTASVARALGAGESTVCRMAAVARCAVLPVDMGMLDFREQAERGRGSSAPARWGSATPPPRRRWPAPCWAGQPPN